MPPVGILNIRVYFLPISVSLDRGLSGCCSSQWMAPVDRAFTALWPSYRRWEEKEEVRGGAEVIAVEPPDAH